MAVDLLGPAANLLAYQVDKRLDGVAKAQVATRLAAVYLMDHKPQAAVDALRNSQISGLPDQDDACSACCWKPAPSPPSSNGTMRWT